MMTVPAMADPQQIGMGNNVAIAADANSADCDHDVLATYTGPTNLEADWTANQITLHWYNDNTEINVSGTNSATCTYDGAITLPSSNPTKTGYTFKGWQVRGSSTPIACNELSCVDLSLEPTAYYSRGYENKADICSGEGGIRPDGGYEWWDSRKSCSSRSEYSDLSRYEWKVVFDYGTVKGTSTCASNYSGNSPTGTGNSCWCKITDFNGTPQTLSWMYMHSISDLAYCQAYCANSCANVGLANSFYRAEYYGLSQNVTNCESVTGANACLASFNTNENESCVWSKTDSACYNTEVDSCADIEDADRCRVSTEYDEYIDEDMDCYWDDDGGYCYRS